MRNILDINFCTKINGVSSASTDYNSIELSIIPNEMQKTNFKIEVTDYASILHTSNVISLIDGRINYTIPFEYWKGIGVMKVRLLSSEGNSSYFSLTNKVVLNGNEQIIIKYGEPNFEISVVEKSSTSSLIDLFYPVGHVVTNSKSTFDPNKLYPGTKWVRIKGRVIVGVDEEQSEFSTVNKAGGEKEHTLSVVEMPSHTHTQNAHNHSQNAHGHTAWTNGAGGHNHIVNCVNTSVGTVLGIPQGSYNTVRFGNLTSSSVADHTHGTGVNNATATNNSTTATNTNTGGSDGHNNLQPYITKYVWERIS